MFASLLLLSLLVLQGQGSTPNSCYKCGSRDTAGQGSQTPCSTAISDQSPEACNAPETLCMAVWNNTDLKERKCDPAQETVDKLKKKGYTEHQHDYLCNKNSTTSATTCFCTAKQCNDEKDRPKSTSGASNTAGGILAMAGAILLARVV